MYSLKNRSEKDSNINVKITAIYRRLDLLLLPYKNRVMNAIKQVISHSKSSFISLHILNATKSENYCVCNLHNMQIVVNFSPLPE